MSVNIDSDINMWLTQPDSSEQLEALDELKRLVDFLGECHPNTFNIKKYYEILNLYNHIKSNCDSRRIAG